VSLSLGALVIPSIAPWVLATTAAHRARKDMKRWNRSNRIQRQQQRSMTRDVRLMEHAEHRVMLIVAAGRLKINRCSSRPTDRCRVISFAPVKAAPSGVICSVKPGQPKRSVNSLHRMEHERPSRPELTAIPLCLHRRESLRDDRLAVSGATNRAGKRTSLRRRTLPSGIAPSRLPRRSLPRATILRVRCLST
jgi:hypothetical protein